MTPATAQARTGVWYGLAAYGIWGLFPLFWKLFPGVPALQLFAHRTAWSFVALVLLIAGLRGRAMFAIARVSARVASLYVLSAVLIGVNWFLYVWAVNAGFVIETSLGYFITPLVNVLLGVAAFRERLRPWQWVAVALATVGVLWLTRAYGTLPWVAVGLALSFGTYGLVKKKAPLPSLDGLVLETAMLFLPAVLFLLAAEQSGTGAFGHGTRALDLLLASAGVITVVPLLLFASAVQRIPLSMVGILQYVAPTIQFFLGVMVFGEPFSHTQLIGFAFVWTALAIFAADGLTARSVPAAVTQ